LALVPGLALADPCWERAQKNFSGEIAWGLPDTDCKLPERIAATLVWGAAALVGGLIGFGAALGGPWAPPMDDDLAQVQDQLAQTQQQIKDLIKDLAIDTAGMFDPTPVSDLIGAARSIRQGDILGAGLSAISAVPVIGDMVGKPGKLARLTKKLKQAVEREKKLLAAIEKIPTKQLVRLRNDFDKVVRPDYWKNYVKMIDDGVVSNPFGKIAQQATTYNRHGKKVGGAVVDNIERMRKGLPPIGQDGFPVNLHHIKPLRYGGSNAFDNLMPILQSIHSRYNKVLHSPPFPGYQFWSHVGR
jgi:hypothetical protein